MLLVYGTTEGQTRKIARFVADRLIQRGNQVSTVDAAEQALPPDPCAFDVVLVAASIHAGRYQSAVIDFVRENLAALSAGPSAFLSVSLAAASKDPEDLVGLKQCGDAFFRKTGWTPVLTHHVAGAFRYTAYGFFMRWVMKYIAHRKGAPTDTGRDYELTDWEDLARFADALALAVTQPSKSLKRDCAVDSRASSR
ncbi:MAG: flavodoxin domain-containing protein [Steroidobacteraceae bacterium]